MLQKTLEPLYQLFILPGITVTMSNSVCFLVLIFVFVVLNDKIKALNNWNNFCKMIILFLILYKLL